MICDSELSNLEKNAYLEKDLQESKVMKESIERLKTQYPSYFQEANRKLQGTKALTLKEFKSYEAFFKKLMQANRIRSREEEVKIELFSSESEQSFAEEEEEKCNSKDSLKNVREFFFNMIEKREKEKRDLEKSEAQRTKGLLSRPRDEPDYD